MLLYKIVDSGLKGCLVIVMSSLLLSACMDEDESDERYSISGVITAADSSMVDSDVNNPQAFYLENNHFSTAQRVGNPLNLAGYVNVPNRGVDGRSFLSGDRDDVFRVDLIAGQRVMLTTSDWSSDNDLDLIVYDLQGEMVGESLGVTATEQVVVADTGHYYIHVYAYAGASNYTLNLGVNVPASTSSFSTSSEFVEGEAVIVLKEASVDARRVMNKYGLEKQQAAGSGMQLWRLPKEPGARISSLKRLGVQSTGIGALTPVQQRKRETLYMIKALAKDPQLAFVEPNYIYQPTAAVDDEYYNRQWHYPLISLDRAWDLLPGVHSAIVAVIDSGTLPGHPDLVGQQLASGYDFVSDVQNSGDGDGLDLDPTDEHGGDPYYVFHGAHVAGTVAAKSNNGQGVAGVAGTWPVKLMALRVLGSLGGTSYDISQAIYYAAGLPNDSGVQLTGGDVASVINMSLGGPSRSEAVATAVAAAIDQGIVVIAAAGNDGSSMPMYPASLAGVISVSAVGADKQLASYSNYGAYIDIAAPGGDIDADFNRDGVPDGILSVAGDVVAGSVAHNYAYLQGTSMASPHVAGVAALMKTLYPAMTSSIFEAWLRAGRLTTDLGSAGRDDTFGYGLVDAYKAVLEAKEAVDGSQQPLLYSNPSSIDFGLVDGWRLFDVSNLGGGSPTISSPASSEHWLTVDCERDSAQRCTTDTQGLGRYVATIDRSLLAEDANYSATITFTSNIEGGLYTLPVTVQRLTSTMVADAGYLYVALFEQDSRLSRYSVAVTAVDGQYHYQFEGVKPGSYEILAGSDADNDDSICDRGESCGGYPFYGDIEFVKVDRSRANVNFSVGIGLRLSATNKGLLGESMEQREVLKRWRVE
ncbi:MAG: S8 family serine peptidase [Gammaproteobacteria bacterium]|nr:S8 family serine peptidase [Gammaproteobacteria bacterium]